MGINEETGWYDEEGGGGGGGGRGEKKPGKPYGRRWIDKQQEPQSKQSRMKSPAETQWGGSGCMLQSIGLFGLGVFVVSMAADSVVKRIR